ncbi:MAG: ABC transporter substrate-binding protein [Pseudomonadota bacterium]
MWSRILTSAVVAAVVLLAPTAALPDKADTSRIVSIGSSVTETLYALGVEDKIVAVDTTSIHPPRALEDKASVGYMRRLSPEGVISVGPSVIFAIEGAGPPSALDVLRQGQINVVTIKNETTARGAISKVQQIAALVGKDTEGSAIAERISQSLKALETKLTEVKEQKSVLFLLSTQSGRLVVGGQKTSADAIIRLAGAANAVTSFHGYKQVSLEALSGMKPDAILIMQRSGHSLKPEELLTNPVIAKTPAGQNKHIIAMDGAYLLGFGPRVADAARDLASQIYPDLKIPDPSTN